MQYFVMLVSDQTMPNLTFLTHLLKTNEGLLIFLTTQQMKDIKKVEAIISALNYQGEYTEILLEPENLKENQSILKENIKDINSTFIVNLTCGNKIMTLSAYLFFSQISNASIYYLPINSNTFNLIYPLERDDNFTPDYLQSIELVLKSYNIDIESLSQPLFDYETSLRFYHFYHDNLTPNLKRGLIILRNLYHNNKKLRVKVIEDKYQYPEKILNDLANQKILQEDIDNILKLLFVNGFPEEITNKQKISTVYIDYISGGWFEEYIYYNLQKTKPQDLLLNVRATNLLNNEFDVFMLKNNILYFIECKTSVKVPKGNIINDTLYKLDSISHPAGLTARKILMCLDEEIFNKESVRNRAKQTRIKIITGSQLIPDSIVEHFMRL